MNCISIHHPLPLLDQSLGPGTQHQWSDTARSLILIVDSLTNLFFPCQYESALTYGLRYYPPSRLDGCSWERAQVLSQETSLMLMNLTQTSGRFLLTETQDYVSSWKLQTTFIVNSWKRKKKEKKKKPQVGKLLHLSVKNLSSDVQSDIEKNI